jgi:exopolysaccharide biosynthesis polyprenyl glycosylphosphotransferase
MKRFELTVALLLIPLDFLMILCAALTAYFLRFEGIVTKYRPVIFELDFGVYLQSVIPLILIWLLIFAASGLYNIRGPRRILSEVKKIIAASFLGFAAVTILIFLRGELFNSRFIVLAGTGLAILFVVVARIIVRLLKFLFYKKGIGVRRVILVGSDKNTVTIKRVLNKSTRSGLTIVQHLHQVTPDNLEKLKAELPNTHADLILQADVTLNRADSELLIDFARDNHIQFAYVADLFDTKVANTEVQTIADMPVVEIKQTPLEGWGRIIKRLFDIIAGTILFILALPVMFIIALLIKLESRGPVIYKNQRVGKNGRLFPTYKFRRLKAEYCTGPGYDNTGKAEALEKELIEKQSHREGPLYKITDDPRNTRIGAFLEKSSLDELPQFLNVILGNMSLVGPRPHQPKEVELYKPAQKRVLAMKPGITGLAQISGRSDLDFDEEARLDTFYMENWTLRTDIAVLLKTPFAVLRKHK